MTELAVLGATAAAPFLAAGWLIDNALLPALRALLTPFRPVLERKYPAKGRHTHHGKESSAELEVGRPDRADHGQPAQHRPDHGGDAAGRTPDSGSGAGAGDQPRDPGHRDHSSNGQHDQLNQAADHAPDDLTGLDPEDTATIAVFREINQEHLVPPHEPQDASGEPDSPEETPGPAGLPDPTRAAGEAAGPGDTLDALIERHRQQNVADPQLGDWIREALGADSVRVYLERMETALRPVTT